MSRNMELIDVLAFNTQNEDQFETISVPYTIGGVTKHRVLIVSAHKTTVYEGYEGSVCLRVVDVTDPRSPNTDYLRIHIRNTTIPNQTPKWHDFGITQVYKDTRTPESGTFNGDIFLLSWVGEAIPDNGGSGGIRLRAKDDPGSRDMKARFAILNLSQAILLKETSSPSTNGVLDIPDANYRSINLNGTDAANRNVYVGYVPSDYDYLTAASVDKVGTDEAKQDKPHALNVDPVSGIMTLSPHRDKSTSSFGISRCFIDIFDLKGLATTIYPTTSSTANPTAFNRLSVSETINSVQHDLPITTPYVVDGGVNRYSLRRDIAIEKLTATKVRLVIASPFAGYTTNDGLVAGGGVYVTELDYSTPTQCTLLNTKWWKYDSDREYPGRKLSQANLVDGWSVRRCHTAVPMKLKNVSQPIVLTTDELASPHTNPLMSGTEWPVSITTTTSPADSWYTGGRWFQYLNHGASSSKVQDDRRIGTFLRAWKTQTTSGVLELAPRGTGTDDGPLGLYDAIESTEPNDLYYASYRNIPASSASMNIASKAVANPGTGSNDNLLGPSTTHRPHVITPDDDSRYDRNGDDVVLSGYAQGVRVIGLEDVAASPYVIKEKAFFDYIPRLSYREWDPYFYMLSTSDVSAYQHWNANKGTIGNYFQGVWHSYADFGDKRCATDGVLDLNANPPVRLPSDEKFIYSMGFGEGKFAEDVVLNSTAIVPQDPAEVRDEEGRNWLPKGGFLVLRYFDGKLGGTIKGYEGTGSTPRRWSRRPYQTINLQGDFTVERDVTIASGACVQLLPGHENDPGIFANTSLLQPSSGTRTVYVDGVLNVSIPEGDQIGTDIVIDVPIVVRDGGVMNIYGIRTGKKIVFKKKIVVQSGGTWKFHPTANVELHHEDHESHGRFIVDGDNGARVTITSRRDGASFLKSAYIVGRGTTSSEKSSVSIEYADVTNVFTDLDRITVPTGTATITESTFKTTRTAEKPSRWIMKMSRPLSAASSWDNTARRQARVTITNSSFKDVQSNVLPRQSIQFGVFVSDAFQVRLTNVEVDKLRTGLLAMNNDALTIRDSEFSNCVNAAFAQTGGTSICNTLFEQNEFSSTVYGTGSGVYYDNHYTAMKGGASIQNSGGQRFWKNAFDAYCYGVLSWGSTVQMRTEVRPGLDIELGRNDFNGNDDLYGVWGCGTVDIGLARGARLYVNCGYNKFSGESQYHVTGDNTCPEVDVSYNQWNPGANFMPRFNNIGWFGGNRDVEQDRNKTCGLTLVGEEACQGPIVKPRAGENYEDLGFDNGSIYGFVQSVRSEVNDGSLDGASRRDKAWEYYELVSRIDSSSYNDTIKSDMASIAANTGLDSNLRSACLFVKAAVHVAMAEFDSARTVLSSIRSTHPMRSDSVPSTWLTLYIDAVTDTTMRTDSLIGVYIDRVIADMRRKTTYGSNGLSRSTSGSPHVAVNSDLVVAIDRPTAPNPSSNGIIGLTLTSSRQVRCTIEIVNVAGQIAASQVHDLELGSNQVSINTDALAPGTYQARIRCDDSVQTASFVVTR